MKCTHKMCCSPLSVFVTPTIGFSEPRLGDMV